MIKTQEVKEVYMTKEDEDIVCWDDERRWQIKTKGLRLHGDLLFEIKAEILIIKSAITGVKLSVDISSDGYLSITQLAQMEV